MLKLLGVGLVALPLLGGTPTAPTDPIEDDAAVEAISEPLLQDVRLIYKKVYFCKFPGSKKWRPGRCPSKYNVVCVNIRGKVLHAGHCK